MPISSSYPVSLLLCGALIGTTPALAATGSVETVLMNSATLVDELMDGMAAYTLLLPEGWSLGGGITWNPLSTWAYVSADARASAPDGSHVQFLPSGSFTYFNSTPVPGAPQQPRPQMGQMTNGKMFLHPGQSPVDFVTQTLFPAYHPAASQLEVLEFSEVKQVGQQYRELFAPTIRDIQSMNRSLGPGLETKIDVGCPRIRVRYTEAGKRYDEQFTFMYYRMDFGGELGMGMRTQVIDWSVFDVRGLRAPAGQLDAELSMLHTISSSARPTRKWKAIVDEINKRVIRNQAEISQMRHRNSMQRLESLRRHSEKMRRANEEIMEANQDSWERSQRSQDRVARAWSNAMLEVDDYALPDGSTRSLDSNYDHVYVSGDDSFLFTDDANFDPNVGSTVNWSKIEPVTPQGAAHR